MTRDVDAPPNRSFDPARFATIVKHEARAVVASMRAHQRWSGRSSASSALNAYGLYGASDAYSFKDRPGRLERQSSSFKTTPSSSFSYGSPTRDVSPLLRTGGVVDGSSFSNGSISGGASPLVRTSTSGAIVINGIASRAPAGERLSRTKSVIV